MTHKYTAVSISAIHRLSKSCRLEELEQQVDQLAAVLHDTELCLEERSRQVQDLELEISAKVAALETLKKEKHSKTEEVAKAQQV